MDTDSPDTAALKAFLERYEPIASEHEALALIWGGRYGAQAFFYVLFYFPAGALLALIFGNGELAALLIIATFFSYLFSYYRHYPETPSYAKLKSRYDHWIDTQRTYRSMQDEGKTLACAMDIVFSEQGFFHTKLSRHEVIAGRWLP